jgi:methylmalonyl-CoA mutase cobalamin-binding subunit
MTYTIGTLAGLTGLSPHTIRAWERRYQALAPGRSDTNRRVYGDDDVERLSLIKQVVDAGHSIGHVAGLPISQLRGLVATPTPIRASDDSQAVSGDTAAGFLDACMNAVEQLDAEALSEHLFRGAASLGVIGLLDGVVVPLLADIGARWRDDSLGISQEHMATAVLRTYLDRVRVSMPGPTGAPRLLLTTPRHQMHELGSLMAAIVAAADGWSVAYLGPNLPAAEIAHAAHVRRVRAIGLSLIYPEDDPSLADELRRLRDAVGDLIPIFVGGRATADYAEALDSIDAVTCPNLSTFRAALAAIPRG